MPRVLCTLENASTSINGVPFVEDRGQMISADVSDDVAANFALIPGYSVVAAAAKASKGKGAAAPVTEPADAGAA